mgnify:FL=1
MSPETMGTVGTWGPILIMVLIFYFLLYRPQKNEQKRRRNMLDNLKKGNRVMTIGGIYGQVTEIKDKIVKIKIAEHVEIEVARSSINANVSQENAEKKA